jgi:hypothetical protein
MAAAVAAATVEPATTTVEAVAAMESAVITAAMETAAVAATDEAVGFTTPVAVTAVSIVGAMPVIAMSIVAAAIKSATVEAMPVEAMEPGAGADEDAAGEVVRSVETVRSASVRIVAVVTVSADWRRADGAVHGTYSNGHANLCVGASRSKKQNSQQSSIF